MRGPATMPSSIARLSPNDRPADVADGREAAHQRVGGFGARDEVGVADVARHRGRGRPHEHRVPVRVDQAGHQRAAAAVDDRGGSARLDRNRVRGNARDDLPVDQHVGRTGQRAALPSKTRTFWNSVTGADGTGICCAMHTPHAAANSVAAIPNRRTVAIMGVLRSS